MYYDFYLISGRHGVKGNDMSHDSRWSPGTEETAAPGSATSPGTCLPGHRKLLLLPSGPTYTEKYAPFRGIVSTDSDRQLVPPTLRERKDRGRERERRVKTMEKQDSLGILT